MPIIPSERTEGRRFRVGEHNKGQHEESGRARSTKLAIYAATR